MKSLAIWTFVSLRSWLVYSILDRCVAGLGTLASDCTEAVSRLTCTVETVSGGSLKDAFSLMQAVEAAALSNTESAASPPGRAEHRRATECRDRGRGRPPSPIFGTGTACCQQWW